MRFRLLIGQHVGLDKTQKPTQVRDLQTGELVDKYPTRTWNQGDIIVTDHDLIALFGKGKFERIDGGVSSDVHSLSSAGDTFPHGQVLTGFQGGPPPGAQTPPAPMEGLLRQPQPSSTQVGSSTQPSEGKMQQNLERVEQLHRDPKQHDVPAHKPLRERYNLEGMTNAQLRQLAESEEVDLGNAQRKEEILQILKSQN